jgi:hypothetical protein
VSLPVHSHRSVDVFVVDTPRAAGVALAAPRSDAESTHVLCRHSDETLRDFSQRVQRRIARIQHTRRVHSLWYVVGAEAATADGELPLLGALLPLLDAEASLTVVAPGSLQSELFEGIDSVLQRRPHDLTVHAQLYASTPPPSSSRAQADRLGGWFSAGSHAKSARAYVE